MGINRTVQDENAFLMDLNKAVEDPQGREMKELTLFLKEIYPDLHDPAGSLNRLSYSDLEYLKQRHAAERRPV